MNDMSWEKWKKYCRAYNRVAGISVMVFGLIMLIPGWVFLGTKSLGWSAFWFIVMGIGFVIYITNAKKG